MVGDEMKYQTQKTKYKNEGNPNWRGANVKYDQLHDWIYKNWGQPKLCDTCGTTVAKRFEWANISGRYLRERTDWKRLCTSCHNRLDDKGKWVAMYWLGKKRSLENRIRNSEAAKKRWRENPKGFNLGF